MPQPWQSECPPRSGCTPRWFAHDASSDETSLTSQADVGGSRSGEDLAHVGRVQVAAAEAVDVAPRARRRCRRAQRRARREVGACRPASPRGRAPRRGRHSSSAAATAAAGKGRNDTSFSSPAVSCSSRSSSTTSLIVPAVEPSATSARVASSSRYASSAPYRRPDSSSKLERQTSSSDVERGLERGRLLAAQLEVVVGHRERPLRRRARRCRARVRDAVVADEARDFVVGEERDRLRGVRDREAVEADEHRQQDVAGARRSAAPSPSGRRPPARSPRRAGRLRSRG